MKKKVMNIIEAILQAVALFLWFSSDLFKYVQEKHYTDSYKLINGSSGIIRFSDIFEGSPMMVGITIFLIICSIIMCLISAMQKSTKKDSALHAALPIINIVLFIFFCNESAARDTFESSSLITFTALPVLDTILLLLFAAIVVGFVKRSRLIVPRTKETLQAVSSAVPTSQSNADELKKYKDLLDQGVITQEEFDAKKKQLLGL